MFYLVNLRLLRSFWKFHFFGCFSEISQKPILQKIKIFFKIEEKFRKKFFCTIWHFFCFKEKNEKRCFPQKFRSKKKFNWKKIKQILFFMTISSPEREAKKVKIAVDRNPVETSFEKWACVLKKGDDIFYKFCFSFPF